MTRPGLPVSPHFSRNRIFVFLTTDAPAVQVAGSWNAWREPVRAVEIRPRTWRAELRDLTPGTYFYKFQAGDGWTEDPSNPRRFPDGLGGVNSVLEVG